MKESLLTDVFLQAGFFLALSALVIPILRYFKIPVVLGYLLAGIILGPYALGAFADQFPILQALSLKDTENIKVLAELGIVLLLFVIGLELTPSRLWQMRNIVFGLGGAQVLLSSIVIGVLAYLWGNNAQVSLLLGLGLALSSTAIVIQWLHEKKLLVTHVGRTSFGILLFQDLAVIPILLLLTILSIDIEENIYQFVLLTLFNMCASVIVIYYIGRLALKPVFLFANKYGGSEVFMALSLLVIVLSSSAAAAAGLSMALGAFIAGLLLSDTEYRHEISSLIIPFKSMLLGIFFLSFGMGINLNFIAEKPFWLLASVIGLMGIKAMIIFTLCKLWRQSTAVSIEASILLSQAGEFGLLVVGGALAAGIMDQNVGQFMLILVGITMILSPALSPLARKIGIRIEQKNMHNKISSKPDGKKEQHIVIFGFGRIGKAIAEQLSSEGLQTISFDMDILKVHHARSESYPIYYGDATKKSTYDAAQIDEALCVVLAMDDPVSTQKAVRAIRKHNTIVPIIVRTHDEESLQNIEDFENIEAIAEHTVISTNISNRVLEYCGYIKNT